MQVVSEFILHSNQPFAAAGQEGQARLEAASAEGGEQSQPEASSGQGLASQPEASSGQGLAHEPQECQVVAVPAAEDAMTPHNASDLSCMTVTCMHCKQPCDAAKAKLTSEKNGTWQCASCGHRGFTGSTTGRLVAKRDAYAAEDLHQV